MAVNKVVKSDGSTIIDITPTTALAEDVAEGKVFYSADGKQTLGMASSGEAVKVVDTESSTGGIIRDIVGMDWSVSWLPPNAKLVASHEEVINLSADTNWDAWTPSTTARTLLAAGTTRGAGSYTIDADNYQSKAIIGLAVARTDVVFKDGVAMAKGYGLGRTVYCVGLYAPVKIYDYATPYYGLTQTSTALRMVYHTSATATTIYTAATYGIGLSGGLALSVSSATGTSRTVGFTRPTLTARCRSTEFSTACAANIDSALTNTYIKTRLYLIDKEESLLYKMFDASNGSMRL